MKPHIRSVSKARSKQLAEYEKVKLDHILKHPDCFVCECWITFPYRELHHFYGRVGRLLAWSPGFRTICEGCHYKIHAEPKWARTNGFLAPLGCWNDYPRAVKHYESIISSAVKN